MIVTSVNSRQLYLDLLQLHNYTKDYKGTKNTSTKDYIDIRDYK